MHVWWCSIFLRGGFVVWAFLGFLIFLGLIIFAGLRNYRKIPVEFANVAHGLGITLERNWGFSSWDGAASPVRYGPCYTGTYRDLVVVISRTVDNEGRIIGTAFSLRLVRSLSLPLFGAFHIDPFASTIIADEYRDIYLKRVDAGIVGLKVWSSDQDKAMMLLQSGDVGTRLESLTTLLQRINSTTLPGLPRAGFMVNDQVITLLVTDPAMLDRELVEGAFLLDQGLSGSGFGKPGGLVSAENRGSKVLAMMLLVLFMGFIIGVMVMGILKLKLPPVLSVWGLN